MYWNTMLSSVGIRTANFASFESAKKHHDSIKPIRGDRLDRRPIGTNRRYKHMHIVYDNLSHSVSAILYSTKCVTLFDNGLIKIEHDDYITPTTVSFIEAVLPSQFGKVYKKRRRMIYAEPMSGREFVVPDEGIWLKADENWSGATVFEGEHTHFNEKILSRQYEYRADRTVLNGIRAKLRPFLDAVKVMNSMSTQYTSGEMADYFPEVVDAYMLKVNLEIAEAQEELAKCNNDEEVVKYLGSRWVSCRSMMNDIVISTVSMPSFQNYMSVVTYGVPKHAGSPTEVYMRKECKQTVAKHINLMSEIMSGDSTLMRKAMIRIAMNVSNNDCKYQNGWGNSLALFLQDWEKGEPEHHINARGTIAEGKIPDFSYYMSAQAMENYLTEVIKYFYADIIFRKVEVQSGVVPSDLNLKYVKVNRIISSLLEDNVTVKSLCPV